MWSEWASKKVDICLEQKLFKFFSQNCHINNYNWFLSKLPISGFYVLPKKLRNSGEKREKGKKENSIVYVTEIILQVVEVIYSFSLSTITSFAIFLITFFVFFSWKFSSPFPNLFVTIVIYCS